jgi:hypothetical protein
VAVFGLSLLLSAARRTSSRGSIARQGLKQSRGETAAVTEDRDKLIDQRDAARAETASALRNGSPDANLDKDAPQRSLLHPLGKGTPQATTTVTSPDR